MRLVCLNQRRLSSNPGKEVIVIHPILDFHWLRDCLFQAPLSPAMIRSRLQLIVGLLSMCSWTGSVIFAYLFSGDNVIVGSYDRRLCWFDMDLSVKPYRTLKWVIAAIWAGDVSGYCLSSYTKKENCWNVNVLTCNRPKYKAKERQIIRGDCSDSPLNEKKPSFEMLLKAENDHCAMYILYFFLRFFGYR